MSVVPFKTGGLAGLSGLANSLANVTQTTPGRGSGLPILRMGRDGQWMYGPENIEPQQGSHWAVNPGSLQHGYVAWVRNSDPNAKAELKGEAMVGASQPKPDRIGLPQYDNAPWEDQLIVDLLCLNGDDAGTTVQYKVSSIGGREALLKLISQIMGKAGANDPAIVPVIELLNSSYSHKKWNKVYVPVFSVIDWLTGLEEDPSAATAANQAKAAGTAPAAPAAREPAQPVRRAPVGGQTAVPVTKPAPTRKRPPAAAAAAPEPASTEPEEVPLPPLTEVPPFRPDPVEAAQPAGRRRRVAN
jgi:hypothetical protein